MKKHEIRSIGLIGTLNGGIKYWRVMFRRYGIVDARDYLELEAIDEADAYRRAIKKLEKII